MNKTIENYFLFCLLVLNIIFINELSKTFYIIVLLSQVGILLYKGYSTGKLLNPYYIYVLIPTSLLLYNVSVSTTYLVILSPFIYGLVSANVFALILSTNLIIKKNIIREDNSKNSELNYMDLYLFVLLSLIPHLYFLIVGRGFILEFVLIFFVNAAIVFSVKSKNVITITGVAIFALIMSINDIRKLTILNLIVVYIVSYYLFYAKKRHTRSVILLLLFSIFALIYIGFPLVDYMRNRTNFSQIFEFNLFTGIDDYYSETVKIDIFGGRLRVPYLYFVSSWRNLQYVIETQESRTYGLWLIRPFLGYLQIDGLFASNYTLVAASSFNTFTYLTVFYKDFGLLGTILGSFIIGSYVVYVYNITSSDSSVINVTIYSSVMLAAIQMYFSNHFFMLSYPFTVFIVMKLYGYLRSKMF